MRGIAVRFMGLGLGVSLVLTGCEGGRHSAATDEFASTRTALLSGSLSLVADSSLTETAASEHCHVPTDVLTQLGSGVGRQLRVRSGSGSTFQQGLCTVTVALDAGTGVVRMAPAGIARLDMVSDAGVSVVLTPMHGAAHDKAGISWHAPTDSEATLDSMQVTKPNELIERLADNGLNDTLIYTAPHGGNIELKTAEQVEHIAPASSAKVSTWRVKGWYEGSNNAKDHWHITSADIDEHSFRNLGTVMGRDFKYAVSFHGYADTSYPDAGVLVGGREDLEFRKGVAEIITDALRGTNLAVLHVPPQKFAASEEANFVNQLALGHQGLQLEQSHTARTLYWEDIADAVKAHYTCLIDTSAEDSLSVSGVAVAGHSNGTVYAGTGCGMYAADAVVNPRGVATTYTVSASTSLAGLSPEDCEDTEWYLSLYKWAPVSGRYRRVGGTRGIGLYTAGACLPQRKSGYGAVTIQAPMTGMQADQYRVVAWARRYPSSGTFVSLPVSVNVGP